MPLFGGRASMLEVQNQALIKTAKERAQRIEELECELQTLRETVEHQTDKLRRELQQARSEVERLTLERDFYSKRALALEQHNREVTEAATKYSLWGQRLERELAKIDPDGARARQFGAWSASQVSALEPPLRGAA
jgi:chromosome segregation ATPase